MKIIGATWMAVLCAVNVYSYFEKGKETLPLSMAVFTGLMFIVFLAFPTRSSCTSSTPETKTGEK